MSLFSPVSYLTPALPYHSPGLEVGVLLLVAVVLAVLLLKYPEASTTHLSFQPALKRNLTA